MSGNWETQTAARLKAEKAILEGPDCPAKRFLLELRHGQVIDTTEIQPEQQTREKTQQAEAELETWHKKLGW